MKVTKYPQSCLLIEKNGRRIVIDPGDMFAAQYTVADLGKLDAVLYTHQHADHFDQNLVAEFQASGIVLYGNAAVAELIGHNAHKVESGQTFELAGFTIKPHDLPHCKLPDGSAGPQNTGYIIDDYFFHPGDGVKTNPFQVDNVALPIAGPDISFLDAIQFTKEHQAKKVIPIHYHGIEMNPASFVKYFEWGGGKANVIILKDGKSVEL